MKFQSYDLGILKRGAVVVVQLSGNAANVQLMDSTNFSNYKRGKPVPIHRRPGEAFSGPFGCAVRRSLVCGNRSWWASGHREVVGVSRARRVACSGARPA